MNINHSWTMRFLFFANLTCNEYMYIHITSIKWILLLCSCFLDNEIKTEEKSHSLVLELVNESWPVNPAKSFKSQLYEPSLYSMNLLYYLHKRFNGLGKKVYMCWWIYTKELEIYLSTSDTGSTVAYNYSIL